MNALILFFVWVLASISGGDPCDNPQFAAAYADECGEDVAPTAIPKSDSCVTDISNGF
ncbi:MAG: hypothetical protein ACJAZO_000889 [Myxococcota bacterium]|jgi:hypothetical protein